MGRKKIVKIEIDPDVKVDTSPPAPHGQILTAVPIAVDLIDPNPKQPRKNFDQARLEELAASIKEHGVIQPVVVETAGERFILHDGERRLRAARLAGLAEIPAAVVPPGTDPRGLLIRAIVANDQREDLSAIERAQSYQELANMGLSDAEIAQQVGKSRPVVANTRRLLQLPEERQQQVAAGDLSERQAMALLTFYQLPEAVQKKVGDTWEFKDVLAKPEKYTSDQARDKLKSGLQQITAEIKLFTADEELGGPGVRHSKCTDCPFYLKVTNQEPRCTDEKCNRAKRQAWQRRLLEETRAAAGVNYVDPGRDLNYYQYTEFYGSRIPILEHALANKCPHLVLRCGTSESNMPRPEGASKYIEYICLHPGKGEKSCKCRQAINQDAAALEKANKAEIGRIKGQAIASLALAIESNHVAGLRALVRGVVEYGDRDKVLSLDREALARKAAAKLIEDIYLSNNDPASYQKTIDEYLLKISLVDQARGRANDLEEKFQRIIGWTGRLYQELATAEAIRGNLTNLARLAEEAARELEGTGLADFNTGHDALKTRLLGLLEIVEAGRDDIEIEHTSWLLTAPPDDSNFKSTLARCNAATCRYALALVPSPEGHKGRIEAINRRLNSLKEAEVPKYFGQPCPRCGGRVAWGKTDLSLACEECEAYWPVIGSLLAEMEQLGDDDPDYRTFLTPATSTNGRDQVPEAAPLVCYKCGAPVDIDATDERLSCARCQTNWINRAVFEYQSGLAGRLVLPAHIHALATQIDSIAAWLKTTPAATRMALKENRARLQEIFHQLDRAGDIDPDLLRRWDTLADDLDAHIAQYKPALTEVQ